MSQVFANSSLFKNDRRSAAEKLQTLAGIGALAPEALTLGEIKELSHELLRRLKIAASECPDDAGRAARAPATT